MSAADRVDGGELKRVNSYQWPSGHVGHLTEGQKGALEKFKVLCEEKGYYTPRRDDQTATHDDETLLRYLRARKFIPKDAFTQFKDTEDWRKQNSIDQLYDTIDINEYEQTRVLYPQWTGRRDKRGIPLYVFEVANLNAKDVSAYQNDKDREKAKDKTKANSKVPRKMLRLFALYENLCRFVLPLCAAIPDRPNPETPVSQSNNIVDISKVGLKQFWTLRAHLQDSSSLATAHYPETLDRIFIVGAPSFFPTVWDWAKNWFDPITVSKIFILKSGNVKSELEKYIDLEDLPKKYGGNLEWEFGDMPALEPVIAQGLNWKQDIMQKGHRTLPIGPMKWVYDEKGDLSAVASGSENGVQRHQVVAGFHPEAGVTRLALTPGQPVQINPALVRVATNGVIPTLNKRPQSNGSARQPPTPAAAAPPPAIAPIVSAADSPPKMPTQSDTEAFDVPYRDHDNEVHHPPIDGRQGTSASRYEQQAATHAHGQLAHSTPEVKTDGQGVEHSVMEPRTVGQAPKETKIYKEEEEEQPGIVAQAQEAAGNVVAQATQLPGLVAGALGFGGKKEEENEVKVEEKKEDSRVDGMEPKIVEEFLREGNMSKPANES